MGDNAGDLPQMETVPLEIDGETDWWAPTWDDESQHGVDRCAKCNLPVAWAIDDAGEKYLCEIMAVRTAYHQERAEEEYRAIALPWIRHADWCGIREDISDGGEPFIASGDENVADIQSHALSEDDLPNVERESVISFIVGAGKGEEGGESPAESAQTPHKGMDTSALEQWLWDAACEIRGPLDAPKFKDYILPLVFLKRLSDVFDDEVARLGVEFGAAGTAAKLVDEDHKLVRFYLPPAARWQTIATKTTGLGELLTDAVRAVARENPRLQGVIDVVDFNATTAGQRIVDDDRLVRLVQVLGRHRLGLTDVEPDILGRAYEYLIRKFAEGQGQSAGEFYTPREVAILMSILLAPEPGMQVYDPCCGSAGLLIKCHLRLLETHGVQQNGQRRLPPDVAPLHLYGQEINPSTFAMSRMNAFIHDMEADIALGDTMHNPRFTSAEGRLRRFDIVTANPMWNQDFPQSTFEADPFERFDWGAPPSSTADWGWVQHMMHSLDEKGRMAVVLDTGAVSRGSGSKGRNRERDIRRRFVEEDLIETVVLLPENLFYNTPARGIVMVLNRAKQHPGEIMLINASKQFEKGRPKNELTDQNIDSIAAAYQEWKAEEALSAVVTVEEVVRNDHNLSPSRYVAVDGGEEVLPLEDVVVLLAEAEEERAVADQELHQVLHGLGFEDF